ncbi:MAG: YebC/PmpR family DNA-binding transcriptional regulator [Gemmatimonadetes bacterium]|nr:YebC/PmpR family DNA-binding transcriptional regulator [Gemmatimonadota bacterium]
MAGHSKWAQIKRKKAVEDQKRGKVFSKLIRELTVSAREGGGDREGNPRLRAAIEAARAANMPKDNIEKAILRGTGELPGASYQQVNYEGYGPGGVALFIETLTDNANRTVAEVRHVLEKYGGRLGAGGSVAWNFERRGKIYIDASRYDEEMALEAVLEAGADDMVREDGSYTVTSEPARFHAVQDALRRHGIEIEGAELALVPRSSVALEGRDAERLLKLLEMLEELDDVQHVYSNFEIDETVMAEVLSGRASG